MENPTELKLKQETEKWKSNLKEISIQPTENPKSKEFIKNINAYIKDTDYFLQKKDYIRAFEAIIWAWAWLEIGLQNKIIKKITD